MLIVDRLAPYEPAAEVLADRGGLLSLDDVARSQAGWEPRPSLDESLTTFWIRVRLRSALGEGHEFVLRPSPFWHEVDLYVSEPSGDWRHTRSGWNVPLRARPLWNAAVAFPILLRPGQDAVAYVRLHTSAAGPLWPDALKLRLEPWALFFEADQRSRTLNAIYAGIILAMVLYNLFLFLAVKDRVYLLYVLYAGSFGLIWVARSGIGLEYLWPALPGWNAASVFYLIAAAVLFGNRFVQVFLDTRKHARRLHTLLAVLSGAVGVAVVLGLLHLWTVAEPLLAYVSLTVCLAYLAAGATALRGGFRPARLFLIACGALILGVIAYVLTFLGFIPRSFLSAFGVQIGSAAEVVLLAFALGDRINVLKREKEDAQALYRLGLEREVRERTADLARETTRLEGARAETEEANRRLQEANQRLAKISLADVLTGIANRRHFDDVLDAECRRSVRAGQPLSLILIDIDHFKAYNDHFGHPAGDRCLQQVAATLSEKSLRAGDLVARYGGEEFVVVLPGTDGEGAVGLAEKMRAAVEDLGLAHAPEASVPVVTISAGVAAGKPAKGDTAEGLLAEADRALYTAKREGRNRVRSSAGATAAGLAEVDPKRRSG